MTDGFLAQGDMERALGIEVRPALAPPPHLTSGQTMNSGQILPRLTLLHRDYSFDQWRCIDLNSGQTMVCGLALGMQRALGIELRAILAHNDPFDHWSNQARYISI